MKWRDALNAARVELQNAQKEENLDAVRERLKSLSQHLDSVARSVVDEDSDPQGAMFEDSSVRYSPPGE